MEFRNNDELQELARSIKTASEECSVTPEMVGRALEIVSTTLDEQTDPATAHQLATDAGIDAHGAHLEAIAAQTAAEAAQGAAEAAQVTATEALEKADDLQKGAKAIHFKGVKAAEKALKTPTGTISSTINSYEVYYDPSNFSFYLEERGPYHMNAAGERVPGDVISCYNKWTLGGTLTVLGKKNDAYYGDVYSTGGVRPFVDRLYVDSEGCLYVSKVGKLVSVSPENIGENVVLNINPETNMLEAGTADKTYVSIGPNAPLQTRVATDGSGNGVINVGNGSITVSAGTRLENVKLKVNKQTGTFTLTDSNGNAILTCGGGISIGSGVNLANNVTITPLNIAAWNDKVDKVAGKGLSTYDFDDSYKSKLDNIGLGSELGSGAVVCDNAIVGEGANVGAGANIGECVDITTNTDDGSITINGNYSPPFMTTIGGAVTIGQNAQIGEGAKIGANARLGDDAIVRGVQIVSEEDKSKAVLRMRMSQVEFQALAPQDFGRWGLVFDGNGAFDAPGCFVLGQTSGRYPCRAVLPDGFDGVRIRMDIEKIKNALGLD